MNAAVENMELKGSTLLDKFQSSDHCVNSAKDLVEQEDASTDSDSEDESDSSDSSSNDLYEVESTNRYSKKSSFADQGGGDADVLYDSDWSTDTVIVVRPPKKEPLPSSKNAIVLCNGTETTAVNQEKQSTADLQLDALCVQMKEMKMELREGNKSDQEPVDQQASGNTFKRSMDSRPLEANNDELDLGKEEQENAQKQKKQIAHELFQEWLQTEYKRCDGEELSSTEHMMLRAEESVAGLLAPTNRK